MSVAKACLQYRVPYADTDRMGVVYYANYLVYFERVRNQFLRDIGLPYSKLEERGILLPVVHAAADYKQPALFEDILTLYGRIDRCGRASIEFSCEVVRDNTLLVTGNTIHAVVDRRTRKPIRVPDEITVLCQKAQTDQGLSRPDIY